jgi:hypothetical protein
MVPSVSSRRIATARLLRRVEPFVEPYAAQRPNPVLLPWLHGEQFPAAGPR